MPRKKRADRAVASDPKLVRKLILDAVDRNIDAIYRLVFRWQDERAYEDPEDYRKVLATYLPAGSKLFGMLDYPFGCCGTLQGSTFVLRFPVRGNFKLHINS